ncbi:hypothetical protein [Kaarinaea lacus]
MSYGCLLLNLDGHCFQCLLSETGKIRDVFIQENTIGSQWKPVVVTLYV